MTFIIPLGAIPYDELESIRWTARLFLLRRAAQSLRMSEEEIVVRDLVVGDQANAADWVDLAVRTPVVTGQQFWAQDAADLTSNQLSPILASGLKVPDRKFVAFFGWVDLTPNPDLIKVRFKRGQTVLDVWYAEHIYAWKDVIGGVSRRIIVYDEGDPINIEMEFKDGTVDKYVTLFAYIAEPSDETIAAPR